MEPIKRDLPKPNITKGDNCLIWISNEKNSYSVASAKEILQNED